MWLMGIALPAYIGVAEVTIAHSGVEDALSYYVSDVDLRQDLQH